MKKLRLRKWVKVLVFITLLVSGFILICNSDSNKCLILKNLIVAPIFILSGLLYAAQDDLRGNNEKYDM